MKNDAMEAINGHKGFHSQAVRLTILHNQGDCISRCVIYLWQLPILNAGFTYLRNLIVRTIRIYSIAI